MVRETKVHDLKVILELYLCLHKETVPEQSDNLVNTWKQEKANA